MTLDAAEVVIGANGDLYAAPLSATAPDDIATALDSDFIHLGFISEAGATVSDSKTVTDIMAWQSLYPIRRIVTDRLFTVACALRQWNKATVEFAFGATVTANGGSEWQVDPPDPESIDERSVVLEWQDGDKSYRLYIPRGMVTETVESTLARSAAADLPITFTALATSGESIYQMFTDDPGFAVAS